MQIRVRPTVLFQASQIVDRLAGRTYQESFAFLALFGHDTGDGSVTLEFGFEIPQEENSVAPYISERIQQYTNFSATQGAFRCCGVMVVASEECHLNLDHQKISCMLSTNLILVVRKKHGRLEITGELLSQELTGFSVYPSECDILAIDTLGASELSTVSCKSKSRWMEFLCIMENLHLAISTSDQSRHTRRILRNLSALICLCDYELGVSFPTHNLQDKFYPLQLVQKMTSVLKSLHHSRKVGTVPPVPGKAR